MSFKTRRVDFGIGSCIAGVGGLRFANPPYITIWIKSDFYALFESAFGKLERLLQ